MEMSKKRLKEHTGSGEPQSAPDGWPEALNLLSQRWTVEYCNYVDKDENLLGSSTAMDREIRIDATQNLEVMKETLLHEIAHSYFSMFPGDFNLLRGLDKEELEEMLAQCFAVFFMDLTRNCPQRFWERDEEE